MQFKLDAVKTAADCTIVHCSWHQQAALYMVCYCIWCVCMTNSNYFVVCLIVCICCCITAAVLFVFYFSTAFMSSIGDSEKKIYPVHCCQQLAFIVLWLYDQHEVLQSLADVRNYWISNCDYVLMPNLPFGSKCQNVNIKIYCELLHDPEM